MSKRTVDDIIELTERYFIKMNKRRITFYRADRRYKEKDLEKGKLVYARRYVKRKDFEEMIKQLIRKPKISSEHRGIDIPKKIKKVHLRPTKLKYSFKLKTTRKKHTSTFIAYTKQHIKKFSEMVKGRRVPLQLEKGKPKPIIDLKKKVKPQKIIKEWKEAISP